jgi:hypothetical protein
MKRLFLLLSCTLSLLMVCTQSRADTPKKTVVLLVSLDPRGNPKGLAGLIHNYSKYPAKLSQTFNKMFGDSGFDIQVVQNATRYDLFQALHSASNVGVFWVSHIMPVTGKSNSIVEISAPLLDYQLSDVKPLFEEMNPNIRWVSLVACDSDLVINWLKGKSPNISQTEMAEMEGFDTPIDANRGLKKEIGLSLPVLEKTLPNDTIKTCPEIQGYPIKFHRELKAAEGDSFFPAISISVQGNDGTSKIVAAFPEARLNSGETTAQDADGFIPEVLSSETNLHDLEIVFESGISPIGRAKDFQMGTLSVNAAWPNSHWSVLERSPGVPLGVTAQIFEFDGQIPSDLASQVIQPSACH